MKTHDEDSPGEETELTPLRVCVRQHGNRIYLKITSETPIHQIVIVHFLIVIVLILITVIIVGLFCVVTRKCQQQRIYVQTYGTARRFVSRMSVAAAIELSRRWRHMTNDVIIDED